jgi:phosphate/sulfate permease
VYFACCKVIIIIIIILSYLLLFASLSPSHRAAKNFDTDELPLAFNIGVACGISGAVALLWLWPIGPIAKRRIAAGQVHLAAGASKKNANNDANGKALNGSSSNKEAGAGVKKDEQAGAGDVESEPGYSDSDAGEVNVDDYADHMNLPPPKEKKVSIAKAAPVAAAAAATDEDDSEEEEKKAAAPRTVLGRMSKSFADNTYNQDLHAQSMHENSKAAEIWENAELYDENVEKMFTYVQVFTACLNAFAHGANDVANAIAPISAIITIYQTGKVESSSGVQKWLLAYGGAAIVLGLLIYGYKVMKSIGYKLTMMSPSRGASAELAASLTVVTASFLAIPVSSTQCIVGAVSGVGLTQGWRNVQWLFLGRVCVGWVCIFFVSAVLSAGLFAFLAFSPSI